MIHRIQTDIASVNRHLPSVPNRSPYLIHSHRLVLTATHLVHGTSAHRVQDGTRSSEAGTLHQTTVRHSCTAPEQSEVPAHTAVDSFGAPRTPVERRRLLCSAADSCGAPRTPVERRRLLWSGVRVRCGSVGVQSSGLELRGRPTQPDQYGATGAAAAIRVSDWDRSCQFAAHIRRWENHENDLCTFVNGATTSKRSRIVKGAANGLEKRAK